MTKREIPGNVYSQKRFWRQTKQNQTNGCIEWTGSKDEDGYGRISYHRRRIHVHRLVYEWHHGLIPTGLQVLHSCDNRPCVRLSHLSLGTNQENTRQRHERLRDAKADNHGRSKVTTAEVKVIRKLFDIGVTQRKIASIFGINQTAAWYIKARKTWRSVL